MAATDDSPRKGKAKSQTPQERQAALRYNHMMYGPTPGEFRPATKKIDYGAVYVKHPKFQDLITAFKNGSSFQFDVNDKGKSYTISTDSAQILFDGRVAFYSRQLNRFERSLLVDKLVLMQYQAVEAFVHLVFAVIRSFPELGTPQLTHKNNVFFYANEELRSGIEEQGQNLMIGSYRVSVGKDK